MPLVILALLSVAGGYLPVMDWLAPLYPVHEEAHDLTLIMISVAFAFGGIFMAYFVYVLNPGSADGYAKSLGGIYRAIAGKFYVDEAYDVAIVHPIEHGSRSVLMNGVEEVVVEGGVNATVAVSRSVGGALRFLQAGNIRSYALYVLLGAVIFLGVMAAGGGIR